MWISGILASAFAGAYFYSRRKLRTGLASQSKIIQTSAGPVEYIDAGQGPVVVHMHGMLGGYDHWKWCQFLMKAGFKVIVPSRPGYLRTPLSNGKTPAEQATMLAALLDALQIDQVALYAYSQGGNSSLEFAMAYPERCWGLILFSAVTYPIPEAAKNLPYMRLLMSSDFLLWLLKPVLLPWIMAQAKKALPENVQQNENDLAGIREVFSAFFQASLRGQGLINDFINTADWPGLPLNRLAIPTLIMQGGKDIFARPGDSILAARTIPGAHYLFLEEAGHEAIITCIDQIQPEVLGFLNSHIPLTEPA
jgi:pimeloyl-ACP methyl ester carboxylesterase